MKKKFFFLSAITLATTTAHAQSGSINISSGDGVRQVKIITQQKQYPTLSNAELDQAINDLMSISNRNVEPQQLAHQYNNQHVSNTQQAYAKAQAKEQVKVREHIVSKPQPNFAVAPKIIEATPKVVSTPAKSSVVASLQGSAPATAARLASRAAHGRSVGRCALYVRKALQSAGYEFTPKASAYQYAHGTLAKAGFTKISNKDYVPQLGDVVVFNRTKKNPHGHIQIYDGKQWVSDFRQPKFSPYSQHNGYTVWRDSRYLDASSNNGTMLAMNEH